MSETREYAVKVEAQEYWEVKAKSLEEAEGLGLQEASRLSGLEGKQAKRDVKVVGILQDNYRVWALHHVGSFAAVLRSRDDLFHRGAITRVEVDCQRHGWSPCTESGECLRCSEAECNQKLSVRR